MAYFSNSSDGSFLDFLCGKCIHGYDEEGNNHTEPGCPVYLLQLNWNYVQLKKEPEAEAKKYALDLLVPGEIDNDNPAKLCAMFIQTKEDTPNDPA